jgi:hypothetical protein
VLERLQANPVTANSAMLFPFPFGGGNAQAACRRRTTRAATRTASQRGAQIDFTRIPPRLGIKLIRAETITLTGRLEAPPVALISESGRSRIRRQGIRSAKDRTWANR